MLSVHKPIQIEEVLRSLGFQNIRRKKDGFTACCVFHQERNPSFSIGDNGLWMCWSCGVKGNLRQLHQKLGVEFADDWRFSLRMMNAELANKKKRADIKKAKVNLPEDFVEYSLPSEVPAVIAKRLSWDTIKAFHLGYCYKPGPNYNRCIIPVYHRGQCVGYHGRALDNNTIPRYYNPAGFEIKDYVFNYDGCDKGSELLVLEGAFNAMSMVEKGFKNTIATFGTKFKPDQVSKIMSLGPDSIVLCFDRDESHIVDGVEKGYAGQKAAMRLAGIMAHFVDVSIMPLPFGKDPNDLPAETLRLCYGKRIPFDKLRK